MAFDLGQLLQGVSELGTKREQIEYLRLDQIREDPNNFYQLSGIEELAANIQLCGLQQPIRVRPVLGEADRYMIVSGHRRRKAVEILAVEDSEKWGEVPCIVEDDAASDSLQQLRLIYANANTRTMTPAEVSEQAVQVEKLLYQLKEEGYEFPGRMRDHVAQAVGASKSKLARLKVIRDDLAADWRPAWKGGTLGESTAYELAKMPLTYQALLFEEKRRTNANLNYLYADDVKKFAERASAIEKLSCDDCAVGCENAENKIRKAAVAERWGWFHCDNKCCRDCPDLLSCKRACPRLKETVKSLKADAKERARREDELKAERERPKVDKISALWQRFGLARELAYKDFQECKKVMGGGYYPYLDDTAMKLECGEANVTMDTFLPCYPVSLNGVNLLSNLADFLDCSIDYLLCRTDVREMAQEAMSESGAEEPEFIPGAWYSVNVEPPVGVPLILIDSGGYADTGKYKGCGEYTMDYGDPIVLWTLEPKEADAVTDVPVSESGTGWQTGKPEAYGTYVAYVQIASAAKKMLRELLWDGEEWFLFGAKIADDVKVCCWMERPEEAI